MLNAGKRNVLGILMNVTDYEGAVDFIVRAARARRGAAISALAVHGLMTGVFDREQKFRLNHFDLLVPDGQPVRWVLNWLYRAGLRDRVYGPDLTRKVCARAATERLPVYFYGSTPEILAFLRAELEVTYPGLIIAGMQPSKFRRLTSRRKNRPRSTDSRLPSRHRLHRPRLPSPGSVRLRISRSPADADSGRGRRLSVPRGHHSPSSALDAGCRPRMALPSAIGATPPLAPLSSPESRLLVLRGHASSGCFTFLHQRPVPNQRTSLWLEKRNAYSRQCSKRYPTHP